MNKKKNRKSTHFYDILSNPLDNVNRGRVGIPYVGQYRIARETTQSTKHSLRVKKKKRKFDLAGNTCEVEVKVETEHVHWGKQ